MTTPAQRLLKAAELLEGRAGEATEGPWNAQSIARWFPMLPENARYIATMHPGVALALASVMRAAAKAHQNEAMLHGVFNQFVPLVDLLLAGEQ